MTRVVDRPNTDELVERLRTRWAGMAGQMGMGLAVAGFLVLFLGWNSAAGVDFVSGQIPQLISGGATGLGLIVLGGATLVSESNRRDRQALEQRLEELTAVLARLSAAGAPGSAGNGHAAAPGEVIAGRNSYHLPSCHLVGDHGGVQLTKDAAEDEGLEPCRVCRP